MSVPTPVLLTATVWLAGLVPPCTALKDNELGLRVKTGLVTPTVVPNEAERFTTLSPRDALIPVMLTV